MIKVGFNSYSLSRLAIALIWMYHGLIPKLVFKHATELELIEKGPVLVSLELTLILAGITEVVAGLCVLIFWRHAWPVYLSLAGFVGLLFGALVMAPELATHAFNPVTLTLSAILFCLIQLAERKKQLVSVFLRRLYAFMSYRRCICSNV